MPTLIRLILPSSNGLVPVVTISDRLCALVRLRKDEVEELGGIKIFLTAQEAKKFNEIYERYEEQMKLRKNGSRSLTSSEAVELAVREYCQNND